MTALGISGAIGPYTVDDRDQWAHPVAAVVGDTHTLDEIGHAEKLRRRGAD
jgi:hypothetical protein